jgi:hypothetical protein
VQGGPQFPPMGAEWYAAQPGAQPQAQLYAQPYPQPQAQPYMPQFAQPYAAPQGQPGPYGQPPVPYAQPQGQPVPYAAPQPQPTQAPPVAPVSFPNNPAGPGAQGGAQNPQQALARQITAVAKSLEQAIPVYQILISVLADVAASAQGQAVAGIETAVSQLKEAAFHHYATLGALRRALAGEMTPDVIAGVAVGVNFLNGVQAQVRPLFDQLIAAAASSPDVARILTGLSQMVVGAEGLLKQASGAVQALVGPQIWEAAKAKVSGTMPVESGAV